MDETSKASVRRSRDQIYATRYFVGSGLDIGAGLDSLGKHVSKFPKIKAVRNWDLNDGDAQFLHGVGDESFDFVYSSHCLEHMENPMLAISNWLRVLKLGGFLIISVPDEDMYEHGIWPSPFNLDHKWSFTIYKDSPELPNSINVLNLVKNFSPETQCERVCQIKDGYIDGLLGEDQTLGNAECAIEFVLQKRRPPLSLAMQQADQLEWQGQEQKACNLFLRVIQEAPVTFDAYNRLTNILQRRGNIAEAESVWRDCLSHLPDSHAAKLYLALFLISIGRYDEGFSQRDVLVADQRRTPVTPPTMYPKWQGESLQNKSIVIWTEFGFGDEIMFARFADVFKRHYHAAKVSIVCQKPLASLFNALPGVDAIFADQEAAQVPKHDFWVFPHSIPVHYSLEKNGIPALVPYLKIPEAELNQVQTWLPLRKAGRLRVGLVSRGSASHENDQVRSIADLNVLKDLFELPGIDWIDLQKDVPLGGFDHIELPKNTSITHLGGRLTDFMQTGAICAQLDLLISVDTSIVHLAGALNIPVCLMLPTFSDWRWGVHQINSLWYPNTQIFRQEHIGQWAGIVNEIRAMLCDRLRELNV